jgi:hypothetical protein
MLTASLQYMLLSLRRVWAIISEAEHDIQNVRRHFGGDPLRFAFRLPDDSTLIPST